MVAEMTLPPLTTIATDVLLGAMAPFLLPICLLPPLHSFARKCLLPLIRSQVSATTGLVIYIQTNFQNPVLSALITLSNTTVSVEFYVLLLSFFFWTGRPVFSGLLGCFLSACLYFGNAMKDLVGAPRPFTLLMGKSKVKFQGQGSDVGNAVEHGLPSTHVLNTAALVLYMIKSGLDTGLLPNDSESMYYSLGIAWVLWIGCGRLYCGMHSTLDLFAGWFVALTIFVGFQSIQSEVLGLIVGGGRGVAVQLAVALIALRIYPQSERYTPSYEYVVSMVAGVWGANLGRFFLGELDRLDQFAGYSLDRFDLRDLQVVMCRIVVGLMLLLGSKMVSKPLFKAVMGGVYGQMPFFLRWCLQPPVGVMYDTGNGEGKRGLLKRPDGSFWDVEICARFLSYLFLGFVCTYGCCHVFSALGI